MVLGDVVVKHAWRRSLMGALVCLFGVLTFPDLTEINPCFVCGIFWKTCPFKQTLNLR